MNIFTPIPISFPFHFLVTLSLSVCSWNTLAFVFAYIGSLFIFGSRFFSNALGRYVLFSVSSSVLCRNQRAQNKKKKNITTFISKSNLHEQYIDVDGWWIPIITFDSIALPRSTFDRLLFYCEWASQQYFPWWKSCVWGKIGRKRKIEIEREMEKEKGR